MRIQTLGVITTADKCTICTFSAKTVLFAKLSFFYSLGKLDLNYLSQKCLQFILKRIVTNPKVMMTQIFFFLWQTTCFNMNRIAGLLSPVCLEVSSYTWELS